MAIPEKPLEVNAEIKDLTLGEVSLFNKDGFDTYRFVRFLIERTNWTVDEVHAITVGELEQVARQLGEAVQRRAVPLSS